MPATPEELADFETDVLTGFMLARAAAGLADGTIRSDVGHLEQIGVLAKAKGRLRGKQPRLTTRQAAHLVQLHAAGEHTIAELAELFAVGRSTVYRALQRDATRNVSEPADAVDQ